MAAEEVAWAEFIDDQALTPDGSRPSKTFDRKADADRWAAKVEHELATGTYVDPAAGRVRAEAWLAQQVWRDGTRAQAESNIRNHVVSEFGRRPLASIHPSEVQAWVRRLSLDLAPSTTRGVFHYLRSMMRAAVRGRLVPTSPCDGVRLPRPERKPVVPLEVAEVAALAQAARPRFRAAIILAAGTRLRQGEAFGLTLPNVQMLRRRLIVEQQIVTPSLAGGRVELGPPKHDASYRAVPMPPVVIGALAEHLKRYPVSHPLGG